VLAAALLLLAAAPAAATPAARHVAPDHPGASWLDAVAIWLAWIVPGSEAVTGPAAAPQALGGEIDPAGAAASSNDRGTTLGDGPTVEPQVGAEIGPYG
jgi:hypothetical protein